MHAEFYIFYDIDRPMPKYGTVVDKKSTRSI